jgi:ABC-type proline/glycine betaine transport system permease subunit
MTVANVIIDVPIGLSDKFTDVTVNIAIIFVGVRYITRIANFTTGITAYITSTLKAMPSISRKAALITFVVASVFKIVRNIFAKLTTVNTSITTRLFVSMIHLANLTARIADRIARRGI